MKTRIFPIIILVIFSLCLVANDAVLAAQGVPGGGGGGGGGGHQPPSGETAANNLSFPVILSDNATPAAFPVDGAWRFAPLADPAACIGEAGVASGTPVPPEYLCYYGRQVIVSSETGAVSFVGSVSAGANQTACDPEDADCKVWWLQKRTQNFWKAFSIGHNVTTPLVVSAVDVGDLLESSPTIATRQIRVEFNLLQSVAADDPDLGQYVVPSWTNAVPAPCIVPAATGQSIGCFAALPMSGAVPGTQQTGNEIQGTDFGPGPAAGLLTGTLTLLDPTTVRGATTLDGTTIPIHALVYSNCARLLIQKIEGTPTWDKTIGQWSGSGVGTPSVNVAAYTGAWSVEITSGGSIVYGYNWNAKTASTGTYRLTFVLDGNDTEGPQCTTTLATKFETPTTGSLGTQLVNTGEATSAHLIYANDSQLGDEGGIAYLDLKLTTKGGGGGGGGRR